MKLPIFLSPALTRPSSTESKEASADQETRLNAGEKQPESQPESLAKRVLLLLENGPMAKTVISAQLGQEKISGQLNKVIRQLINDGVIEYTIPEKPKSRLQKYRLLPKGNGDAG